MEKSVMDTICSSFDNFFDSEKKIAKYIINHYDKVVDMTVGQLAKASGASEASVSRFCKKIGVKGFHHLKISLAKEMVESDINEVSVSNNISFDDISQSLQNILANKVEELKQTVSLMDNDQLPVILKEILNARSVQFVAVGNTIPVAIDGTFKFNQIGILSFASGGNVETADAQTMNLNNKDCLIVISNSGESAALIKEIELAKKNKIKIIGITNNPDSPIALNSDYHLRTGVRQTVLQNQYYFSRVAAFTIIEALFLLLIKRDEKRIEKIKQHEKIVSSQKI